MHGRLDSAALTSLLTGAASADDGATKLVNEAITRGTTDNATALVINGHSNDAARFIALLLLVFAGRVRREANAARRSRPRSVTAHATVRQSAQAAGRGEAANRVPWRQPDGGLGLVDRSRAFRR